VKRDIVSSVLPRNLFDRKEKKVVAKASIVQVRAKAEISGTSRKIEGWDFS